MTQAPFSEISLGNLQVILRDVFWLLPGFSYLKHCPTLNNSLKHCPTLINSQHSQGQEAVGTLKLKIHQIHSKSTSGSILSHSRS